MRWLLRAALALLALAVAALIAIAIALPRIVESGAVRARIERAAESATGRALRFESLAVGLLPPAVRVLGPRLAGETADAPPLLEAREVSLRIALLPLLARTVLVDSLVVDAATLRLERTDEGLVLPEPAPADDRGEAGGGETADGDAPGQAGGGLDLAVRSIRLRESRVELVDRSVRPATTWELVDLDAEAEGHSLDAPIDVSLETALASGGRVAVSGTATRRGDLDLEATLDALEIAPLAPYLDAGGLEVAGRLGGSVTLVGPADDLTRLAADLRGADVRFRREDLALRGAVALEADVSKPTGAADGRFEVDATDAELVYAGGFTKPPGTEARVTGRVVAGTGGGYAFEDVRLKVRNLEAKGRVGSLSPLRVEASAEPFALAGWEALVPALGGSPLRGRLGFTGLRFDASPASLRGRLTLERVGAGAEPAPLLSGLLEAEGDAIRSREAVLALGGEEVAVDASIRDLFGAPRHRIAARADDADSRRVIAALFAKPDAIEGPLDLDLDLTGPLGADPLAGLAGRIAFGVTPGRLVDVSILKLVVARLGSAGQLASALGRALTGDALDRYYDDRFELFRGELQVEGGRARTEDLTLRYPNYGVVLRGSLGLTDLDLRMTGELEINEQIDAALARALGSRDHVPASRVLPLAAVRGTLDDPEVALSREAIGALVIAYGSGSYRDKLRKEVEEELGAGSGDLVDRGLETLQGILGSRRKPAAGKTPEAAPAGESEPAPESQPSGEAAPAP